jgi:hypothetical protein
LRGGARAFKRASLAARRVGCVLLRPEGLVDAPFRPPRAALMLRAAVSRTGRFLRALRAGGSRQTLRVLYALEFFPHASETYIATELAWMRHQGVTVEVWSERDAPVPDATDVPVHRGDLAAAIASFRPQLVHGHHLEQALGYAPIVAAAGLPMTVRAHGFALDATKLAAIAASSAIRTVFHFPHLLGPRSTPGAEKVRPMTCCFDPALCHLPATGIPAVVRTGLASPPRISACSCGDRDAVSASPLVSSHVGAGHPNSSRELGARFALGPGRPAPTCRIRR